MKRLLLLTLILSLSFSLAFADEHKTLVEQWDQQTAQVAPAATPEKPNFLKDLVLDQRTIWSSPARIKPRQLAWLIPLAGTTAILISQDTRIDDNIEATPDRLKRSRYVSYLGSASATMGAAAAMFAIGKMSKNEHLAETGVFGLEALIGSAVVAQVVKAATRRERPNAIDSQGRFWVGGASFPSGHAASSFALAGVIAGQYPQNRVLQIGFFTMAAAVSISRITGKKHYPSDVLVGSAVGYLIGRYVVVRHRHTNVGHALPSLMPYYSGKGGYGLQVSMQW